MENYKNAESHDKWKEVRDAGMEIGTVEDVREFFISLTKNGVNFHPDDDFRDYIDVETEEPSFDDETADYLNKAMERCFEVCEASGRDIYEIGIESDPIFNNI